MLILLARCVIARGFPRVVSGTKELCCAPAGAPQGSLDRTEQCCGVSEPNFARRIRPMPANRPYGATPKPARWIALVIAGTSAPDGRRISPLLRSTERGAVPAPVAARVTAFTQPSQ